MDEFWISLNVLQRAFFLCALGGSFAFIVSMVLQFMAGDHDVGAGELGGGEASQTEGVGDTDVSFKVLSFLGLSTFISLFGLVGLAMSRGSGMGTVPSVFGGLVAGGVNLLAMRFIFSSFSKLQSSGKSNNYPGKSSGKE